MSNFQRVLIIVVLCLAVLLISGILLPRYLYTRVLELRKELDSQSNNSKYNLQANLVPDAEKLFQMESKDSISSRNFKTTEVLSALVNGSIKHPEKIKKRKKRQAVSSNEIFNWKFIFNLTRKRNLASQETSDVESDTSHKDKPLNIAVYAGGEAKKESAFAEIQHNLRSVEHYFKYLLKNAENFTNEEENKELVLSRMDFTRFDADGSGDESPLRGREGKFFSLGSLSLFGFLNSPEKNVSSSTLSVHETDLVSEKEELTRHTESVQSNVTENLLEMPNFQTLSLVSEALNQEQNETSNLPGKTDDGECVECDAVGLESPVTSNPETKIKNVSETVTSSTEFTDEFLEMFCISILKNEGVSQLVFESDKSGKPEQVTNSLKSLENQNSDLLQSPELNTKIYNNILTSSDYPESEEIRQRFFLNLGNLFGLGSGRAADEGSNNSISEEFADVDLANLPTLLDCKKFFRTKSSESNFIDGVTPVSGEASFETRRSTLGEVPKQVLVRTEPNDLDRNTNILFTGTDIELQPTTEFQRDSRFLSIFGFGSGNGESRLLGPEILDTNREEILGSGDSRSFRSGIFDIDRKETLGSGDIQSFRADGFNIDKNELGSGDLRSLGSVSDININESRSGSLETFQATESNIGNNEELGSGDSRSLWSTLLGTERNEFGSGDLRSIGATAFNIDGEDFGSGARSFGTATIEMEKTGSGDFRSLLVPSFGDEKNEFGSGDSFKETVSDLYEDQSTISPDKQRILGFLGLVGSGDGRELPENKVSLIEKCENNCSIEAATEQMYDCDDQGCYYGNISNESDFKTKDDRELNSSSCQGDCFDMAVDNSSETLNKSRSPSSGHEPDCRDCNKENLPEMNITIVTNETFSACNGCTSTVSYFPDEFKPILSTEKIIINTKQEAGENLKTSSNPQSWNINDNPSEILDFNTQNMSASLDEPVTESTLRFLRPIFLTGSGDGGLFGDSGEPINLVEEDEITDTKDRHIDEDIKSAAQNETEKPLEQSTEIIQRFLRPIFLTGSGDRGLFEDGEGPINLVEEESSTSKSRNSLRKARLDDNSFNISEAIHENSSDQSKENLDNLAEEEITSPVTPTRRRGRLEDDMNDYTDFIENFRKKTLNNNKNDSNVEKRTETQPDQKIAVTVPSNVISWNRLCTAARECNSSLNERCVTVNSSRICGCSKGYVRNKVTNKCIVKKIVETSIRLPAEKFNEDLKDPFSPSFQQKRKSSVDMMLSLLQKDPELLRILSEIDIVEFSAGSLVITQNLIFASENKSETELVQNVEDDLQTALRDESVIRSLPLDVRKASLVSVNGEIDYCKTSELNYCSENAYCVSNAALPGSYACHCKEHYRDASFDPSRIGETCIAKCPKEYCGPHGHCELLVNDEKMCLCSGLYFGRKCEIPGLYVLIVLGCVGFISLTMLLLVVFKKRCSTFSYRESQTRRSEENGLNSHRNGQVSDAIALEENVGTRFTNISTPVPHPSIKIIRPTVTESGSSYDYDSTFDSTPGGSKLEADSTV